MAASAKASSALTVTLPSDREVLLTRVFDAPPELLFEAFTKPEHLRHWFGRRDWTMAECEVNLKVGGAWRYLLLGPKEQKLGMHGVYREIQRPERLVYTEAFDEFPGESVVTTTLTEENGRTTLSSRMLCASKKVRDMVIDSGMERGAAETYDRLAEHLATIPRAGIAGPELVVARLFHAPRELVFECWTTPEHLRHWQGAPRGFTVTSSESDIRPGGFFRICMRSPEGVDHWLEGHYCEIVKPERLVFTHAWLDAGRKFGKETLVTITFTERDGGTELALHQTGFHSAESRDGHKYGWTSALDVLADYLAGLQPGLQSPRGE
jgi:uncharacterized protein YndB with AHSA1/START domain